MGYLELTLKKVAIMKKIIFFILLSITAVSCYEDYIFDFDYSAIYFPYQIDVRTFVVGEGMTVEVGTALSGVRENDRDRNVTFELKPALINQNLQRLFKVSSPYISDYVPDPLVRAIAPMPTNYYTLSSPNTIVIKKGQHMGSIKVKADSTNFLADPLNINAVYVIPFSIVDADADTVLESKRTAMIALRYENMLFGKYWHGGSALVNRPGKSDTTMNYFTVIPSAETKVWTLKTASGNSLYANGFFDQTTAKNEMLLTLNGENITVSTVVGSTRPVTADGASSFNKAKLLQNRKLFLKYTYTGANGYTYHCTDTLTFRNRLRDGVNEWQDTNPSHYTK
jgi:hypothetical protein